MRSNAQAPAAAYDTDRCLEWQAFASWVHGSSFLYVPLTDNSVVLHAAQRDTQVSRDLNQIPVPDRWLGSKDCKQW